MLSNDKDQPERGTATEAVCQKKLGTWRDKQKHACTALRIRLAHNPRALVRSMNKAIDIFNRLEMEYKPQRSEIFIGLTRELWSLKLASCKNIEEYANRYRKIFFELRALD